MLTGSAPLPTTCSRRMSARRPSRIWPNARTAEVSSTLRRRLHSKISQRWNSFRQRDPCASRGSSGGLWRGGLQRCLRAWCSRRFTRIISCFGASRSHQHPSLQTRRRTWNRRLASSRCLQRILHGKLIRDPVARLPPLCLRSGSLRVLRMQCMAPPFRRFRSVVARFPS